MAHENSDTPTTRPGLLERGSALAEMQDLLVDVAGGAGRILLVSGEAGAGKSALLRAFSDQVSRRAPVLWGACDPLSSPRPLGPLLDIAPQLGGDVSDLVRAGARDEAFSAALEALGTRRAPTVVVFEDIHWADASTLDFLRFLARRIERVGVLLVVSFRDEQVDPMDPLRLVLGDLAPIPWVRRTDVPGLSEAAVAALAAGSGLDPVALHRETGGNPFFVVEMLSSGSSRSSGSVGTVPATVSDAVLARVARLSPEARSALQVAAAIGARIEPSLIRQVPGAASVAVDECVSRGMLRFDAPHFVFRHELVRQAVLGSVAPGRLAELHAGILSVLRELPADPRPLARLADHAEHAGDAAAVVEFAVPAGAAAAGLKAHREAAFQYGRALRFAAGLPPEALLSLLEARAVECYLVEQLAEAVDAAQRAIALSRRLGLRSRVGADLVTLSRLLWTTGRGPEAMAAAEEARRTLEGEPPGAELAAAYAELARLAMVSQRHDEAADWGGRALRLAESLGERGIAGHALNSIGAARWYSGDAGGEALLVEALEIALDLGREDDVARAYTNLAGGARRAFEFDRAKDYLDRGIAFCVDHDLDSSRLCLSADRVQRQFESGEWAEALAAADHLLDTLAAARITRIPLRVIQAQVAARRGDGDPWALLDDLRAQADQTDELQFLVPVAAARAEARWLAGEEHLVAEEVASAYELAVKWEDAWSVGLLAGWLARVGRLDRAPMPVATPFELTIRGEWRAAAESWDALGFPYEAAMARADSSDEADLRRAMAAFDRLGARPMLTRVANRLREIGVTSVPRGARASTRANPGGLTARELEVLELVEEGLRNAEIAARLCLSEKTVAHHVSAVLTKLDVPTRQHAARRARQLLGVGS